MYHVIIVDDEKNIREGISELVEWEALGCRVVATFRNGEQVLHLLNESREKVHIVITDIKMPVMDGIQLTGILHEKYPEIKVVILTAYTDFHYAQQAIKYQVADFVVKNEFLSVLPESIKKITKRLEDELNEKMHVGMMDNLNYNDWYRICVCEVSANHQINLEQNKKHIENLLINSMGEQDIVLVMNDENSFYFLVAYKKNGFEEKEEAFKSKLTKFLQLAKTFLMIDIRIGVSEPVSRSENITKGKQYAFRCLANVYSDENPIKFQNSTVEVRQIWTDDWDVDNFMRSLFIAIRDDLKDAQKNLYEEFLEYLQNVERPLEQCKSDTHAITSYLLRKVRGVAYDDAIFDPESLLSAVYLVKSKASLLNVLQKVSLAVGDSIKSNMQYQNVLVNNVNEIIKREYKEKLSLKIISQKLFVNSSYLSRTYKKETNMTITDAINQYRIRKAKEILDRREHKVYEVGILVGIEDPAYFTHVFLKYEGKTPSEYIEKENL